MNVAILGDIHGNHLALKKVLSEIKSEGIEHLLIAGDLVGYYYHPDKVFEELSGWTYDIIQGNHDRLLGEIYHGNDRLRKWYKAKYGSGIDCALKLLSAEQCEYLSNLPKKKEITIENRKMLLCHGSPWDPDEYVYPDSPADTFIRCTDEGFDIVIMGHTHYPMEKYINSTVIINPGSVGQPRNNIPGADWAILDLDTFNIQLKHVQYDISTVIEEAEHKDPELLYLAEVLFRKKT